MPVSGSNCMNKLKKRSTILPLKIEIVGYPTFVCQIRLLRQVI